MFLPLYLAANCKSGFQMTFDSLHFRTSFLSKFILFYFLSFRVPWLKPRHILYRCAISIYPVLSLGMEVKFIYCKASFTVQYTQ